MGKKSRRKQNVRRAAKGRSASPKVSKPREQQPSVEDQEAEVVRIIAEQEIEISKLAYKMFLAEGGGELDHLMENGQSTARAYLSQIRADEEGGKGWGPNVTPYEDRMNRSLQLRLIREKQKWIEQCRQRIIESIKESFAKLHESKPSAHLSDEALAKSEALGSEDPESANTEPADHEPIEVEAAYPETQSKPSAQALGSEADEPATTKLQTTTTGGNP